jgi:hypothetical protein
MRFRWKGRPHRGSSEFAAAPTPLSTIVRKWATRRCRDHPDFAIRLSAEGGNLWIDACCRRAAHAALADGEFYGGGADSRIHSKLIGVSGEKHPAVCRADRAAT